jgi:hypothetical protein
MSIRPRIDLYKYYKKLLTRTENRKTFFEKVKILGEGYQGKVYHYKSKSSSSELAIKKIYLDWKEGKYVEDIYNINAFKYGVFIELASSQLINQLILQKIIPNFILNYDYEFEERWDICSDIYPYKSYFYNEFIDDSETYTEWINREHSIQLWYNAMFQIVVSIYALQKYFNMTHLDLHSDNILVKKIKKGGYWTYIINDKAYKVPNLGYQFYIFDFGHAWIPKIFKSWFISQKYKKKQIHKGFDLQRLYKSTMLLKHAPSKFRKDINYIIRTLHKNKNFENIIETIWADKYVYNNSGLPKKMSSKKIDTYDMDKKLKTNKLPEILQKIVIYR